jgi:hypothetical protein
VAAVPIASQTRIKKSCSHNAENPSSPVTGIKLFNVAASVGEHNKPDNYETLSETIRSYEN